MEVLVRYFEGATKLELNPKGDLIDVYARKDVFVPFLAYAMIPLGFAMKLPNGKMAKLYPRSSSFKSWGIIQTNSVGIIDNSYCGDNDEWQFPVQCTMPKEFLKTELQGAKVSFMGTWIRKGDKIGQFEIVDKPPAIKFTEVEKLGEVDRGGFGTSGKSAK